MDERGSGTERRGPRSRRRVARPRPRGRRPVRPTRPVQPGGRIKGLVLTVFPIHHLAVAAARRVLSCILPAHAGGPSNHPTANWIANPAVRLVGAAA